MVLGSFLLPGVYRHLDKTKLWQTGALLLGNDDFKDNLLDLAQPAIFYLGTLLSLIGKYAHSPSLAHFGRVLENGKKGNWFLLKDVYTICSKSLDVVVTYKKEPSLTSLKQLKNLFRIAGSIFALLHWFMDTKWFHHVPDQKLHASSTVVMNIEKRSDGSFHITSHSSQGLTDAATAAGIAVGEASSSHLSLANIKHFKVTVETHHEAKSTPILSKKALYWKQIFKMLQELFKMSAAYVGTLPSAQIVIQQSLTKDTAEKVNTLYPAGYLSAVLGLSLGGVSAWMHTVQLSRS